MRRFAVAIVLTVASVAQADLLPPGTKWVQHVAVFENVKDHPGYVFFVWPRDLPRGQPGNSSVRVSESGEVTLAGNPLARAQHGGPFLFAVPLALLGGDPLKLPEDDWFEGKGEGVLKSQALVDPIRTAPLTERRERFVTRYRLTIANGKLETTLVNQDEPGERATESGSAEGQAPEQQQRWLIAGGVGLTAVVLAGGLILIRTRRGRRNG